MFKDPIVDEVRKIRYEIETECNNDIEKIYANGLETQKKYKFRLITSPFTDEEIEKLAA
jgi:hypothetical protein